MITYPGSKINIGLNIVEKRTDGFHNIETVFYPIPLTDELEIIQNSENRLIFENSGLVIDSVPENNLCVKAYNLLAEDFPLPGLTIKLNKKIPFGAGLGGGSADASFTLLAINELLKLNISKEKLLRLASKIGSDCAFFIENKPMYAFEKGNVFENIDFSLKNYFLILVKPAFGVNTAQAYSSVKPVKPLKNLKELIQLPVKEWKNLIVNDFENSVFKIYPEIEKLKKILYSHGALYASMSGSGSAVYGIFSNQKEIPYEFENYFSWSTFLS